MKNNDGSIEYAESPILLVVFIVITIVAGLLLVAISSDISQVAILIVMYAMYLYQRLLVVRKIIISPDKRVTVISYLKTTIVPVNSFRSIRMITSSFGIIQYLGGRSLVAWKRKQLFDTFHGIDDLITYIRKNNTIFKAYFWWIELK